MKYVLALSPPTKEEAVTQPPAPGPDPEPRSPALRTIARIPRSMVTCPQLSGPYRSPSHLPFPREGLPSPTLTRSFPQAGLSFHHTHTLPALPGHLCPAPSLFPSALGLLQKTPWLFVGLTSVSHRSRVLWVLFQLLPQCLACSSCSINIYGCTRTAS